MTTDDQTQETTVTDTQQTKFSRGGTTSHEPKTVTLRRVGETSDGRPLYSINGGLATLIYGTSEVQQEPAEQSDETSRDESSATYFKSGWDSAIREVALQRRHDRLDEFMHEQRRALGGQR